MSSIYDALKRIQHEEARIAPASDLQKQWNTPKNWAIIIIAVTLSSVITMGLFSFMSEPVKNGIKETNKTKEMKKAVVQSLPAHPQQTFAAPATSSVPAHSYPPVPANPSKSRDEYIKLADTYYNGGNYEKAISTYSEALSVYNNDAGLLNNLGAVMLAKSDYDGAIKYFKVAIMCSKDNVEPVYNLACAYAKKGNKTLALKELDRALKMNSTEVRKWAENDPDLESIKGKWK